VTTLFVCTLLFNTTDFDYLVYDCVSKVLGAEEIKGILYEILVRTHNYGFGVGMVIADGASTNRLMCKQWFTMSNPHNDPDDEIHLPTYMAHPSSRCPVYYVPDPSHVIKKLVASFDNDNHFIYKANPETPDVEPTVRLTLDALYKLFMSFDSGNNLRVFRFKHSHFKKTPFEKMRVAPCRDVLGPQMKAMLLEADRRETLFVNSREKDARYKVYKNIHLLTKPMIQVVESVSSVFDILDRRRQPGLSAKPSHTAELDTFRKAAKW
jgi:hypothetical protein